MFKEDGATGEKIFKESTSPKNSQLVPLITRPLKKGYLEVHDT